MIFFHKIKHQLNYLAVILLLYFGCSLFGQDVTISARLDTTRAMIGDQLRLHLRVEQPAQTRIGFPAMTDTLAGKIEILRKGPVDTSGFRSGRIALDQEVLVTVFDTGFFEIPPLEFTVQNGLIQDTLRSLPVSFEIKSLPVDTAIRDIRANLKAPVNIEEIFPFFLALVAVAMVIALLIYWIRKRMKRGPASPLPISSEPADTVALRELEQLREEKPWVSLQIKLYYIRLTEILRVYIERRYHIMALEQTTDEILASLMKTPGSDKSLKRLASILKLADLVKFAKVIPDAVENSNQLDEAVEFVKSTAPPMDEIKAENAHEHDPVHNNVES
jgi:hypothetical protein